MTRKTENETWFEIRSWFAEPRPLVVARSTQHYLFAEDGTRVGIGWGTPNYVRDYQDALRMLRGLKADAVRRARDIAAELHEAFKDFEQRFPEAKV